MITLTDEARAAYEDYVRKVRACLISAGTANPEDVLADLREHVSRELAGGEEPAGLDAMQAVLAGLGGPEQWVSAEDLPWWRKVLLRTRVGPDVWRLAYASFGALLLGVLLGWVFSGTRRGGHEFNGTVLAMFVVVSFLLSRAAVAVTGGRLESGQKWLVYPSLVLVCVILGAAIVAWAPIAGGAGGFVLSYDSLRQHHTGAPTPGYYPSPFRAVGLRPGQSGYLDMRAGVFAGWAATLSAGVWWSVLAVLLLFDRPRRLVEAVFAPFLKVRKRWATALLLLGLLLLAVAGAAAYAAMEWGHRYF